MEAFRLFPGPPRQAAAISDRRSIEGDESSEGTGPHDCAIHNPEQEACWSCAHAAPAGSRARSSRTSAQALSPKSGSSRSGAGCGGSESLSGDRAWSSRAAASGQGASRRVDSLPSPVGGRSTLLSVPWRAFPGGGQGADQAHEHRATLGVRDQSTNTEATIAHVPVRSDQGVRPRQTRGSA
jgi:hypothetical protein